MSDHHTYHTFLRDRLLQRDTADGQEASELQVRSKQLCWNPRTDDQDLVMLCDILQRWGSGLQHDRRGRVQRSPF